MLDDSQAPGDGSSRILFLDESSESSSVISIEIVNGESIRPIPFHVLRLTYGEYEARFPEMNLNDLFPTRPLDPAGSKLRFIMFCFYNIYSKKKKKKKKTLKKKNNVHTYVCLKQSKSSQYLRQRNSYIAVLRV